MIHIYLLPIYLNSFFVLHDRYAVVAATGVDRLGLLAYAITAQTIMEAVDLPKEPPKSLLPEPVTLEPTTERTLWVVDEINNEVEYIGD